METQVNNTLISPTSKGFDRLADRYAKWAELEPAQCWQEDGQWYTVLKDGNDTISVTLDVTPPSVHSDMRLHEAVWQFTTGKGWNFTVFHRELSRGQPIKYFATIFHEIFPFKGSGNTKGEAALDCYVNALQKLKELNP